MKSANFKHLYAFTILIATIAWAVFCVWITYKATVSTTPVNILGAAGADTLLGALITYNSLIVQHYFRKSTPEDNPPATGGPQ